MNPVKITVMGSRRNRAENDTWRKTIHADENAFVDESPRPKRRESADDDSGQNSAGDVTLTIEGIVLSIAQKRCIAAVGERVVDAYLPKELAMVQQSALAVGDKVMINFRGEAAFVASVMPRTTVLARPDPHDLRRQRTVAANIDIVIHVVSLMSPPLRPRLIDRYMIAIQRSGAEPLICVNKIDLVEDERDELLEPLDVYRDLGVRIFLCSAVSGDGLDDLHAAIAGRTAVLVGHSGVGKSSVVNAMHPTLRLATSALGRKSGKGKHTTSKSTLYEFPDGTKIIDTPGIREFGLWDLDERMLRSYFPEFEPFAAACRFNDCTHSHEPECAVEAAVEKEELSEARFDAYVRILEDIRSNE